MLKERESVVLKKIEDRMISRVNLGFDLEVLSVLDNADASSHQIEALKGRLSSEILLRLLSIASSVYYGSLKRGAVNSFYEAVSRLGMDQTKAFIIILAQQALARGDREIEKVFARTFATAVLGKLLSKEFALREDAARKVELGGLLLEIGRIMILLYRKLYLKEEGVAEADVTDAFIDEVHPQLGVAVVEKFFLPPYLKKMLLAESLVFETRRFALAGVVRLAHDTVTTSFRRFNNKLVLAVPPPSREEGFSIAEMVTEHFRAVGLQQYLQIVRLEETPEEEPPAA
ncbi:MAG: HDOD domain-containing protein [Syntrophales bacterium]|jgi:HD-like signal output (HDOD) protein|nr:HDOD domain-containing protein [Syntrophales bacterium]